MSESLNWHLAGEVLNEYLDDALSRDARAAVAAHLATCPDCAARLARLRAVFARLEALPDSPLTRDLTPGVMAAVRRQAPVALRPIADPRRPAFKLIFAVQLLAALLLLAFAWPFVAPHIQTLPNAVIAPLSAGLAGGLAQLTTAVVHSSVSWISVQSWLETAAGRWVLPFGSLLEPGAVGLGLAMAAAVWLLGNALLLRGSLATKSRRRS